MTLNLADTKVEDSSSILEELGYPSYGESFHAKDYSTNSDIDTKVAFDKDDSSSV